MTGIISISSHQATLENNFITLVNVPFTKLIHFQIPKHQLTSAQIRYIKLSVKSHPKVTTWSIQDPLHIIQCSKI